MTDVADQLEQGTIEPRRDRWDRALLLDANGNRVPHTRASTIAKALDDKTTIINYRQRLTAVGLTRRKDLHDIVKMMRDPEGSDKSELRRIVMEAETAGGAGAAANYGTARHKATERIDQGEDPASLDMPDDMARDVYAYMAELQRCGFEAVPEFCEFHGVLDGFDYNGLGVSGSADKVLRRLSDGALFIGDIKTGQSVKFAMLSWAVQQAIYANFDVRYDVRTDTRLPMPDVDRQQAFIIHMPFGSGRCTLLEVDIANGFRYAQYAVQTRAAQAHGKVDLRREGCLVREYEPTFQMALPDVPEAPPVASQVDGATTTPSGFTCVRGRGPDGHTTNLVGMLPADGNAAPAPAIPTETARRDWLKQRLAAASPEYRAYVADWWGQWNERADKAIPGLNSDHSHSSYELDIIESWCNEAEKETQEDISADPTRVAARAIIKHFPGTIDEGETVEPDQLVALSTNLGLWCQPGWLPLLNSWRDEAIRLGHDFGVKECPTTRRLALYELGANLCNLCEGDAANIDLAWAVLATALGWANVPDVPFGLSFSLLSIEDIEKCMAVVVQTPFLALSFDTDTGCPAWVPVNNTN